jgi:hypothetical protein
MLLQSLNDESAWEVVAIERTGNSPKHLLKCLKDGRVIFKRASDFKSLFRYVMPCQDTFIPWSGYEIAELYGALTAKYDSNNAFGKAIYDGGDGNLGVMQRLWALSTCFCKWSSHAIDWDQNSKVWPYDIFDFGEQMVVDMTEDPDRLEESGLVIGDWRRSAPWFTRIARHHDCDVKHELHFADQFTPPKQDAPEPE